jgi:hypothetical protein
MSTSEPHPEQQPVIEQQAVAIPPRVLRTLGVVAQGRLVGLDDDGRLFRLLMPGERPGSNYIDPAQGTPSGPPVTKLTWEALDIAFIL